MKRCPECRRDYYDDTLLYCLDDGNPLLEGPASGPATAILHSTAAPGEAPTRHQINTTGETVAAHTFGTKRSSALRNTAVGIVVVAILVAGGFFAYRYFKAQPVQVPRNVDNLKTQRLTGDGKTREGAISPDGKFLVYLKVENEQSSLWIKQLQANSSVQVVRPGEISDISALAFTADGNFVYFNGEQPDTTVPTIYRVPTLGGSPTKVLTNATGVTFSSDGKQIAFTRYDIAAVEASIIVANADGTNERVLATLRGKRFFGFRPSWSPDGRSLAIPVADDDLLPKPNVSVGIISTADGALKDLGDSKWSKLDEVLWHPSSDSLIIVASENVAAPTQLWELAYPSGTTRRVTNTLIEYGWLSITADGRSISTIESEPKSSVWVSPNIDPNVAKQVMPAKGDTWGIAWTPDRRVVYISDQSGMAEVWAMNADGSNAKQVTGDGVFKSLPTVSPDGRYIVYVSSEGGGQLVRIDSNGGNPLQLTTGVGGDNPDFSSDGKWVLYSSWVDGKVAVLRVSVDGGEPQKLTNYLATEPKYSPDGKYFACFIPIEGTQNFNRLAIVPAEGGEPLKTFNFPNSLNVTRGPVWTPDGKGITYLDSRGEKTNMWIQPIDGGKPKQVTNFDQPVIARREYSRDGKQIAIVRGELTSNAVLITGFR